MLQKYQHENQPEFIHRKNKESLQTKGVTMSLPEAPTYEPHPPTSKKMRPTLGLSLGKLLIPEIMKLRHSSEMVLMSSCCM